MSTIIDALSMAERENKKALPGMDSIFINGNDENNVPKIAIAEEKKDKNIETEPEKGGIFRSKAFIASLLILAFVSSGIAGWHFYSIDANLPVVSKIEKVSIAKQSKHNKSNIAKPVPLPVPEKLSLPAPVPIPDKGETSRFMNEEGIRFYKNNKQEKAMDSFLEALKLNPDFIEAHFNLALVYDETGKLDEAESEYKKVIKYNSQFIDAYINLGVLYYGKKKYVEAEKMYKNVLKIDPNESVAHLNIGILYAYCLGKPGRAVFHWKQYIEISPKDPNLGKLKEEIRKFSHT